MTRSLYQTSTYYSTEVLNYVIAVRHLDCKLYVYWTSTSSVTRIKEALSFKKWNVYSTYGIENIKYYFGYNLYRHVVTR